MTLIAAGGDTRSGRAGASTRTFPRQYNRAGTLLLGPARVGSTPGDSRRANYVDPREKGSARAASSGTAQGAGPTPTACAGTAGWRDALRRGAPLAAAEAPLPAPMPSAAQQLPSPCGYPTTLVAQYVADVELARGRHGGGDRGTSDSAVRGRAARLCPDSAEYPRG